MSKKVIGLGNALVDLLLRRDDSFLAQHGLPKGSMQLVDVAVVEKLLAGADDYRVAAGGCAANTINGLGKLGVESAFIGKIGDDELGAAFTKDMEGNGVVPKLLKGNAATGRACAVITPDSERTFATYLGAAIELGPDDLAEEMFAGYDYFHIEGYLVQNHDLIRTAVTLAKAAGCKTAIDMASYNVVEDNLEFYKGLLNDIDIVFANEEEAKSFTGAEEEAALEQLAATCEIAVVKLGKKGALAKRGDENARTGITHHVAIDTTGAGDLFATGFFYGLVQELPLEKCCKLGALTSGYIVEVIGAKLPEETWARIRKEARGIIER